MLTSRELKRVKITIRYKFGKVSSEYQVVCKRKIISRHTSYMEALAAANDYATLQ